MRNDLQKLKEIKVSKKSVLFLLWLLGYKIALELGYMLILNNKVEYFQSDFNEWKYIVGTVWVVILFWNIRHEERSVSSFLLNLHLVIGIIPITVIYALCNENPIYYNVLCFSYLLAEEIVKQKQRIMASPLSRIARIPKLILFGSVIAVLGLMIYVFLTNGPPPMTALDVLDVYELRGEDYFIRNEYINYLYQWIMAVLLPFMMAYFLVKKKNFPVLFCVVIALVFYLYSGNKTNLFVIPLVIGAYLFAKYKDTNYRFYGFLTLGITMTAILVPLTDLPFSLFVRRTLVIPANLKFLYYDFFSNNPKLGFAGTLWGSKLGAVYPYDKRIGYIISEKYFGLPEMNSNTGFFAEGFSRFGLPGVVAALILFSFLLILLDGMQKRTGYTFAVTMSVYPIFTLNDGQLIDSLIFGPMLALLFICLFYYDNQSEEGERVRWKKTTLPTLPRIGT